VDQLARFSRLVQMLQEAPLAPNRWDAVVSAIVAATGGSEGILFSPELPPSGGGFWASHSILPQHMETYAAHYGSKDVWRHSQPDLYRVERRLIADEELIDPVSMRRSEFFADFLKPLAIGRLACGVVHRSDSTAIAGGLLLSVFKPMREQGFDAQQQDLMRRLIPHVQAAFDTWRLLGASRRTQELTAAALDALTTAVVLIDQEARVLVANRAAEDLFAGADGLAVRKGVLVGVLERETTRLHAFLADLFAPLGRAPGAHLHRLARRSGRPSYACFAHPLPPGTDLCGVPGSAAAIVFIRDPAAKCVLEPGVLQRLHDLSYAEAVLACLLAQGSTLDAAAAIRGISYETVRCQLKSLFDKTGCRRQAELVALLVGGGRI